MFSASSVHTSYLPDGIHAGKTQEEQLKKGQYLPSLKEMTLGKKTLSASHVIRRGTLHESIPTKGTVEATRSRSMQTSKRKTRTLMKERIYLSRAK